MENTPPQQELARGKAKNEVRDLFHLHGLRFTRQRDLIFGLLTSQRHHLTAEEIFTDIKAHDPGISLATVYNSLEALTECGLIRRLPRTHASGACRYDADLHPHVHLTLDDGRVLDVPEDLSSELIAALPQRVVERLEERLGVRISRVSLDLSGTVTR